MDKQAARGLAIALIVLAAVTLVVLLVKFVIDAQPTISQSGLGPAGPSLASFYGAGIWIYFVGMLAVLVGGIVQLRSLYLKN